MKRVLVGAAVVAAGMLGTGAPPAMACPQATVCETTEAAGEAADAVVGIVVHALWPTIYRLRPIVQSIVP
jgi:hypothetical protein